MEEHHVFKIVLAGDGGVGKSTLINMYVYNKFEFDYKMTIGMGFMTKAISIYERNIKFQIWDAAGQDRFRFMLDPAFQKAVGVLYVFDLTRPGTLFGIKDWIELNKKHNPDYSSCIQLLVGNKLDLHKGETMQETLNEFAKETNYAFHGYYYTSAKFGNDVEKLTKIGGIGVETIFKDLGTLILKAQGEI